MSFLPSLSAWHFALAGVICAAAPVIIHLLNRRRYRTVHWAAMPFLREALQRNRKMMQMRDIILLILRTAAVLLFGLALARPYFAVGTQEFDRSQPLHAILVFDNSLSMGYTLVEGTLLDKAKERALRFIDELPDGSVVTVIPLCGSEHPISSDPYPFKDKGLSEAIRAIEVVDRAATVQLAADAAQKAAESSAELAKRIVFFSDQQASNWSDRTTPERFQELPSMQVVDVGPAEWQNTSVVALRVQDGIADIETPTTFVAEIEHRSSNPAGRKDIQVAFHVGDEKFERTISFDAQAGRREVLFEHTFSSATPDLGHPDYVPVKVALSADNLVADNERHLVVPVVASLPVLFIDQYSDEEEDPVQGRTGETRQLRKLLAPTIGRDEMQRQLINVKHITLDQLSQDELESARLVVIAGVRDPGNEQTVKLLRDYVKQGGQLVIGAGGDFDPQAWTELAWLEGGGILPVPLQDQTVGDLPEDAVGQLDPVFLSFESLATHHYFQLGETSEQQLRDLFSDPLFFKYVDANTDPETLDKLKATEQQRLAEELTAVGEAERLRAELTQRDAAGELDEAGRVALAQAENHLRSFRPGWLRWVQPAFAEEVPTEAAARQKHLEALTLATMPRTLARFTSKNGPAYLVQRRIGQGEVLLVTSGLFTSWNTLPKTDTFFMYDRILRSMIRSTLADRNFLPADRITLPLASDDRDAQITLQRPGREDDPETIDAGFIGKEQLGIIVNRPLARGLYRVSATKASFSADASAAAPASMDVLFTVNGEGNESDLTALSREAFNERAADSKVSWVGAGDTISLAGAQISGQNSWKWLILLVLLFLLAEIALLAWPLVKARLEEPRTANA